MSAPSAADRRFIERRRMRTHVGLYILPSALAAVLTIWVTLFARWPAIVNPSFAWSFYEGVPIAPGTTTRLHLAVTILVNILLLVMAVALLFGVLWARSERRYLRLLKQLETPPAPPPLVEKNDVQTGA